MKDIRKSVRFSSDEFLKTEQLLKDEKVTFSEVVRASLLGFEIKSKSDLSMVAQVAKIGNNINQIARDLNSGKRLDIQVLATLIKIEKDLERLL